MQREQMSDKQKEELRKQLEALRELLRQQNRAGDGQRARLREFARRARGQSSGQPGAGSLRIGGAGQALMVPGGVTGAQASSQGQNAGKPGADVPGSGQQAGSGTDSSLKATATALAGKTQDVTAAGQDSGEGPSASSLVYGAAEQGFVGSGYKRVYSEYKTVAEEALDHDHIPSGYEQYVRRYFQLIRPRD